MRPLLLVWLLGFVWPVFGAAAPTETRPATPVLRLMHGDDPRWAAADFDDTSWPQIGVAELPARSGIYWIRFRVTVPERPTQIFPTVAPSWCPYEEGHPMNAAFISVAASFDLYWDGQLIWRNGQVGPDRGSERPGAANDSREIPATLLGPGEHVVAMRMSSYHYNFPDEMRFTMFFHLLNYDTGRTFVHGRAIFPLLSIGSTVVVALICGAFYWLADRRRALLLCGLWSLAMSVYYLVATWRVLSGLLFHPATYDQIYPISSITIGLMAVSCSLMLATFLEQFTVPRKWVVLACFGMAVGAIEWITRGYQIWQGAGTPYWNPLLQCRTALALTAVVSGWAIWRRRPGAWLALAAAIVGLATIEMAVPQRQVLNGSYLLTYALLVFALFASIGLQIRSARRAARAAELSAARLEIELLKKNLQPHFLLNTLTAISEVVEQDPQVATRLINDLAEEFRTVARFSGERLVPLAQELDLCRAHLRVMSVRTGRPWSLTATGIDTGALVPPAVFLTLVENGFAHQRVREGGGTFMLTGRATAGDRWRYIFFSPGNRVEDERRPAGGTGLRYVKARLEESFAAWSLESAAVEGGWQTVIEIDGLGRRPESNG